MAKLGEGGALREDPMPILTIVIQPTSAGSIQLSPRGETVGDPDLHQRRFPSGTEVELTITEMPGYAFDHYDGIPTPPYRTPATLTIVRDITVTAVFVEIPWDQPVYTLTTEVEGNGRVVPDYARVQALSQVIVGATPDPGNTFAFWSGDAAGSGATIIVVMTRDTHIVAHFERLPPRGVSVWGWVVLAGIAVLAFVRRK